MAGFGAVADGLQHQAGGLQLGCVAGTAEEQEAGRRDRGGVGAPVVRVDDPIAVAPEKKSATGWPGTSMPTASIKTMPSTRGDPSSAISAVIQPLAEL